MFYREAGQFKTTYAADQRCFRSGRIGMRCWSSWRIAFVGVPLVASDYWLTRDPDSASGVLAGGASA